MQARWRTAMVADDTFTTTSATKLYSLIGLASSQKYEHLTSQWLWDVTNNGFISVDTLGLLNSIDNDQSVTGPPTKWADAGADSNQVKQIYLWPIPGGTYTIRFAAYKLLSDVTSSDDDASNDGMSVVADIVEILPPERS